MSSINLQGEADLNCYPKTEVFNETKHSNSIVFSSAAFEENVRQRRRRRAKTLTFSNISVITEDIYLKIRIVVHYQKGNPYQ